MKSPWIYPSSNIADDDHAPDEVPAGQDLSRVAPKSDFDRIPKTEDLRSWKISEYRRPKIFVLQKFPNTEDRRSSFMKNFRRPKIEDLCSWKISEYRRPNIFLYEKFPNNKYRIVFVHKKFLNTKDFMNTKYWIVFIYKIVWIPNSKKENKRSKKKEKTKKKRELKKKYLSYCDVTCILRWLVINCTKM